MAVTFHKNSTEIRRALARLRPSRIAVAYIGADWKDFINPNDLTEIIVSPTIGSNPRAIRDLVKEMTWDNVHFLDALHAKIYCGQTETLVTSANLSAHALDLSGLHEVGLVVAGSVSRQAQARYNDLKQLAVSKYPNTRKKVQALERLEVAWEKAEKRRGMKRNRAATTLADVPLFSASCVSPQDFDVCWYSYDDVKENIKVIRKSRPLLLNEEGKFCHDSMHFAKCDPVQAGRWMIVWSISTKSLPDQRTPPKWFYVHAYVPGGATEKRYPNLATYLGKDEPTATPQPFQIDDSFTKAFYEVLSNPDRFKAIRGAGPFDREPWSMRAMRAEMPGFLQALRAWYREHAASFKQPPP